MYVSEYLMLKHFDWAMWQYIAEKVQVSNRKTMLNNDKNNKLSTVKPASFNGTVGWHGSYVSSKVGSIAAKGLFGKPCATTSKGFKI